MTPAQKSLYNISEAAKLLGVSAVTLRLWERQGKITSSRTVGGQRRYTPGDLEVIRQMPHSRSAALIPEVSIPKFHFQLSSSQKRALLISFVSIIISILSLISVKYGFISLPSETQVKDLISLFQRPTAIYHELTNQLTSQVLASQTRFEDLLFKVNVPAEFAQDIKAPNVLYGLKAGTGVTISAGQNPTISTGNSFGAVKTGSTTLSATGSADLLTFAAGSGISLSADTTTNKLTVTNSLNLDDVGWKDDGTIVRLTTPGDIVAIGAATGAAKLNINTDENRDLITASQSGNLKFRLTSAGIIDTGTWNGSVIGPAYGGTGIANNAASTLTISGNYATTLTLTGTTGVTLPTSGTLYGTATGSITSSQLLTSLSDETGSGVAVFGTSPAITTSLTTPSTTFALINTTATTVNFAGAATALNLGAATGTTTIANAASISGALTLYGTPTIQSTANQSLTLGGDTTGNISIIDNIVASG
ncbi:MAG: helix-turn-helix domain-containing protein, partial [Patescibacteria group bacterium]